MRYLLFVILILSGSGNSFAQDKEFYNPNDIFNTRWYLNFAQTSYFGWNDTSVLYTSVPSANYLVIGEKATFGPEPGYGDPIPDYYYYFQYLKDDGYGSLYFFEKKKDLKKLKNETCYYDVYLNPYEVVLIGNNPVPLQFNDLSSQQTLVFTRHQDTLQLYANLMGKWSAENAIDLAEGTSTDTIVLTKNSSEDPGSCNYEFKRIDGELYCQSNCSMTSLANFKNSGYVPDAYYLFYDRPVYFDLAKSQLIFRGDTGNSYDILELSATEMKLVMHEEDGIMGPPK